MCFRVLGIFLFLVNTKVKVVSSRQGFESAVQTDIPCNAKVYVLVTFGNPLRI